MTLVNGTIMLVDGGSLVIGMQYKPSIYHIEN